MEKLKGIASGVRHTVSVSGGENSQVTTTHISLFQIDSRQIKLKSGEPLMINEGDKVLVVGNTRSGIFNALAYKNCTTNVEGNEAWILSLIFGLILPSAGIAVNFAFSDPFFSVFPKIISGIFIAFGVYMGYRGICVFRAVNFLRKETF